MSAKVSARRGWPKLRKSRLTILVQVFGCGTAAVVTPLGRVKSKDGEFTIGDGTPGPVSMRIREALLAVQTGQAPDVHGWMHEIL